MIDLREVRSFTEFQRNIKLKTTLAGSRRRRRSC